jgi:osmotically-inducible protein OsmY
MQRSVIRAVRTRLELTGGGDIHVDTVAGVATLHGTARSAKVAERATWIAEMDRRRQSGQERFDNSRKMTSYG